VRPAARHAMPAIRNSNSYEMALVAPDMENIFPPPYAGDYSDQLDSIGSVAVPDRPGLGVTYDWEYIESHRIQVHTFT
jgi:L-alanine-DL-glutamate epimerase-like enolase superfamily enzyme